jgi:hypothetical protein
MRMRRYCRAKYATLPDISADALSLLMRALSTLEMYLVILIEVDLCDFDVSDRKLNYQHIYNQCTVPVWSLGYLENQQIGGYGLNPLH